MARPRRIENSFNATKTNSTYSEGNKSAGILDDFAVRGDVATKEGTIQKVPVNAKDIVNKEYVDSIGAIDWTDATENLLTTGTVTADKVYCDYILSTSDNSINVQPTGDTNDFFSFKTPADRPTIKREGGKYIYIESSNVYDVGISMRKDADHSGTVNYYKDENQFGLTSKDPIVIKASADYDSYIKFSTAANVPELAVIGSTDLKINATNIVVTGTVDGIDIAARDHAESHTVVSHSDTTATGAELNTLTGGGDTTLHDHDGISENTSARHTQNTDTALGSGAVAADHGTAATDQIINVCYGTGDPPAANTTTIGTLFVKYTA